MPKLSGFPEVAIRGPRVLPVVGGPLAFFQFLGDPIGRLLALQREFGEVAAIADRSPSMICVFGAERTREVLSNSDVFRHDEELGFRGQEGSSLSKLQHTIISINGEKHARHRRLMAPFFQKARVEAHAPDMVTVIDDVLNRVPVGSVVNVSKLAAEITMSVAVRCIFGLDPRTGKTRLGQLVVDMIDRLTSPLGMLLPFPIPGTPFHRGLQYSNELVSGLEALIAEKRAANDGEAKDVLSNLVRAREEDGSSFSDDELISEAMALIFGGHDTASNTLGWTLFLLEQHPEVLEKVLEELDSVLGGAPPTVENLPKLVLLDRVLKESMRILIVTPTLFLRICSKEDVPLGPYLLPKGAQVVVSPFITHRNPDLYPSPAQFRPERWATLQPSRYDYLPFGAGPRACIGAMFGNLELRVALAMVLQRFRMSIPDGTPVARHVRLNILRPKHGLLMRLDRRDGRVPRPGAITGDIREIVDLPARN